MLTPSGYEHAAGPEGETENKNGSTFFQKLYQVPGTCFRIYHMRPNVPKPVFTAMNVCPPRLGLLAAEFDLTLL